MLSLPFTKFVIACLNGYTLAGIVGEANLGRGTAVLSQTPTVNATGQQFEVVPLYGGYALQSVSAPQFYASAVQVNQADPSFMTVQLDDAPYAWNIYPAIFPNSFFICTGDGTHRWDQKNFSTDDNQEIILQTHNSPDTTNQAWSFIASVPE